MAWTQCIESYSLQQQDQVIFFLDTVFSRLVDDVSPSFCAFRLCRAFYISWIGELATFPLLTLFRATSFLFDFSGLCSIFPWCSTFFRFTSSLPPFLFSVSYTLKIFLMFAIVVRFGDSIFSSACFSRGGVNTCFTSHISRVIMRLQILFSASKQCTYWILFSRKLLRCGKQRSCELSMTQMARRKPLLNRSLRFLRVSSVLSDQLWGCSKLHSSNMRASILKSSWRLLSSWGLLLSLEARRGSRSRIVYFSSTMMESAVIPGKACPESCMQQRQSSTGRKVLTSSSSEQGCLISLLVRLRISAPRVVIAWGNSAPVDRRIPRSKTA